MVQSATLIGATHDPRRSQQVSLDATPYFHWICRCVRRACLCGDDHFSGRSYEHRRQWVVDRLADLGEVFAIDLCSYAVMSNHHHLVVRINAQGAGRWTDREVVDRWRKLYRGPPLIEPWSGGDLGEAELLRAQVYIDTWRACLSDPGGYMKCLSESLARRANDEDGCEGRFRESRFKSQALLYEPVLLVCMAYVDVNPARAGMALTPEESDFTSIQQRTCEVQNIQIEAGSRAPKLVGMFSALGDPEEANYLLPGIGVLDYLALVDWTGRTPRAEKRGAIPTGLPPVLERMEITPDGWLAHMITTKDTLLFLVLV